jgi:hypothetical protein
VELTPLTFDRASLFRSAATRLYPERIEALADLRDLDAEIDVVVTGHGLPELTNAAVDSFLRHERATNLHVVVVESSGDRRVFDRLRTEERISRVLLAEDVRILGRRHGPGSYGQSLSSAVGTAVSRAPHVFFSHSDMLAVSDGCLSWLRTKLTGERRIAGFTSRGVIPFTGAMLVSRALLEEPALDWGPLDDNPFVVGTPFEQVLPLVSTNTGVDSGEQFIYSELAQGRPVYVAASRGGSKDWWQDPLGYYDASADEILAAVAASRTPIEYGELRITRSEFEARYPHVIAAGRSGIWVRSPTRWWRQEPPKWWRCSFDDDGRLVFIHLARGTMGRMVRRWLRFAREAARWHGP